MVQWGYQRGKQHKQTTQNETKGNRIMSEFMNVPDTNEYSQWQAGEFPPRKCECSKEMIYEELCDECQDDIVTGVSECPCTPQTNYDDLCPVCLWYQLDIKSM